MRLVESDPRMRMPLWRAVAVCPVSETLGAPILPTRDLPAVRESVIKHFGALAPFFHPPVASHDSGLLRTRKQEPELPETPYILAMQFLTSASRSFFNFRLYALHIVVSVTSSTRSGDIMHYLHSFQGPHSLGRSAFICCT